jgi:hypothetical protein
MILPPAPQQAADKRTASLNCTGVPPSKPGPRLKERVFRESQNPALGPAKNDLSKQSLAKLVRFWPLSKLVG